MRLKTTLEQWITLSEIDKAGSIQAAASQLNKSHTTLIYAINKLEAQLGIAVLKVEGRRAVLTEDGHSLLRRARSMIEQARILEDIGAQIVQGIESEIVIAVDHLCDRNSLYAPLADFFAANKTTSIQVVETSLSKTTRMVEEEQADLSIITLPITNYPCDAFATVEMLPVVNRHHPLAQLEKPCLEDLNASRQIVIRDLGETEKKDVGLLKSNQRITVDNFDHAWQAMQQGLGYCRFPKHMIDNKKRVHESDYDFIILNIEHSGAYQVPLHITLPKGAKSGPAAKAIYQLLLESIAKEDK